jgi:hypothetical protein
VWQISEVSNEEVYPEEMLSAVGGKLGMAVGTVMNAERR